ncbi:MAG: leucine-rich repeat domain-containing protein [Muribaculaceae bacterium]|nr:leucine-rich repeat domain-containing protein [Muribaculaceae bacterium]
MKRLLIALITVLTASVGHAANAVVVDGVIYTWSPSDGAYIVTGWDDETPIQSLHIHAEVNDLDVIAIDDAAFEDNEDIIYLRIDEGITSIGENAFCRCSNLKTVILPEGLEKIEEEAFAFCTSLTTMVIPSTVTDIYAHAFSGCTSVTDVYFLMTDENQLSGFDWWDGVYPSPGEEEHGGMEFNTNQHTVIHVPQGMLQDYVDSQKFVAWMPLVEDDGCYPLWWIVNYGVEGRSYTVADDLTAVYVDKNGGLHAKDDNHWLTPDKVYSGEIDYMGTSGLMNHLGNRYDQSNWVALTNVENCDAFKDYIITGNSIVGKLLDKKNPVIEVNDNATLIKGTKITYTPNTYIAASFMSRTQQGSNDLTYAFVRPKPQEFIFVDWAIYHDCEDENEFYLPAPDLDNGINKFDLKGGFMVNYDLCESMPNLTDEGQYAFNAINHRMVSTSTKISSRNVEPYVESGLSPWFIVLPVNLPDAPIVTGIIPPTIPVIPSASSYYNINGYYLGTAKPKIPGIYINNNRKIVIR